jgi:fatty acid desaturase
LFRSQWLNRAFGFLLGVVSGMPQYVWSQHHNYHHAQRQLGQIPRPVHHAVGR